MKGSCLCGKCIFDLKGNIGPVAKCHCSKCRKVSGTGSNAVHWARPENIEWVSGYENIKTFKKSDGWSSTFCNECGSPLPMLIQDGKTWVVPAGLLDEDPGVGVRAHIWTEGKPEWDVIGDNAPQYPEGYSE